MPFLDILSGVGNFLGSSGGQALLQVGGQLGKVKELGWRPGASGIMPVNNPNPIQAPGLPAPGFPDAFPGFGGGGASGGVVMANNPVVNAANAVLASPFGERSILLAKKAILDRWGRAQALPVQGLDQLSLGQADDREVAKLAIKYGVIPADSDHGQMLQMAGAAVTTRNVRFSDGTVSPVRVIEVRGVKKRRRRNYNTTAGRRNAARTLRQMGQQMRTFKGLAKLGAQIDRQMSPKRAACATPKRACAKRR